MASYIESTLVKDEKIIVKANLSIWAMIPQIVLGVVFLGLAIEGRAVFILVSLVLWLSAYLRYISTELAFTNKRVIAKFGFIRRKTIELHIGKVESIQVSQGILGRIFNFGTLIVSGAGNPQAPIPGIADPMQFRQAFMQYQDQPHD